ncbi:MAG: CHASE domain-containing protein [Crocinitomicaceae bacterium]
MTESGKKSFSSIFHNAYTAWVILIISLALTMVAWYMSSKFTNQLAENRFSSRVSELVTSIEDRMGLYEQALWGGVALFNASDEVSRKDWENYVATLDIQNRLPGIQGMGYAIPLNELEKDSLVNKMKVDGFEDFSVQPEGVRDSYTSIIYLEPFDWRNQRAFGYDMWSNEMRRTAMQRAVDEKKAATSGIITLVQETENDVQKGFLTYIPVFQKADSTNKQNIVNGWVYAAFRAGDLMKGILGEIKDYDFELFDGKSKTTENLLFDSDNKLEAIDSSFNPVLKKEVSLNIQGRDWTLFVHSNAEYVQANDQVLPKIIAVGGLIIDLLLFFVILSIARNQSKAEELVNQKTAELNLQTVSLEKRNQELSQFAYITSHDLQEPLRTIRSFINLLDENYKDSLDEKGQKFLDIIVTSADRMSDLIVAILDYSRIGTSSEVEAIDTNEIVKQTIADLNDLIERNNATVNVSELSVIKGYRSEFHQLIQNLIANAVKFKKEDVNPVINISSTENSTHYLFKVEDNGIGMEEKYLERIFLIFQRLHGKSEFEGTGIGLAHCRKIVHLHVGEIWVESELGKGSTFHFSIKKDL